MKGIKPVAFDHVALSDSHNAESGKPGRNEASCCAGISLRNFTYIDISLPHECTFEIVQLSWEVITTDQGVRVMLPKNERPLCCEKVALKFDQPWDITGDIAERWWFGTLKENGRVILDMPIELEGGDHHSVVVQPRYVGENLANLERSQQIIVNQKIETAGGELFLIGSIRQARISKTLQANDAGPLAHTS